MHHQGIEPQSLAIYTSVITTRLLRTPICCDSHPTHPLRKMCPHASNQTNNRLINSVIIIIIIILFTLSYNISKTVSSVFVATCNVFLNIRKRRNIIRINPSTMVVDVLGNFYTFGSPTFL